MDVAQLTIPLFVGTVMNWALLGSLVVQVYLYFLAFPRDKTTNKLVVVFIVVAEALQTLGNSHDMLRMFGSGWGNFEVLDEVGWTWFSVPILGSTIGCVGQMFFVWRIYIIGNHTLFMPIVIAIITLFQFGAGIWTGVDICRAKHYTRISMQPPVVWLSATALADLLIVCATVYYLLKAREPGFSGITRNAVNRIIKVTVETGLLCAIFASVDLALLVKFNENYYHLGLCIWLSKVYSNSIMVILNSRAHIGHAGLAEVSMSMPDVRSSRTHTVTDIQSTIRFGAKTTIETLASVTEFDEAHLRSLEKTGTRPM